MLHLVNLLFARLLRCSYIGGLENYEGFGNFKISLEKR